MVLSKFKANWISGLLFMIGHPNNKRDEQRLFLYIFSLFTWNHGVWDVGAVRP